MNQNSNIQLYLSKKTFDIEVLLDEEDPSQYRKD